MSKKISFVVALVGICALSLFLLNCGSSSSRPTGLLYVLTQGINGIGNNVSSFSIDLNNGNLSLINSNASVCCGLPLSILLDPTGATAFVLSQGAISSYPVNSDGSLGAPTVPAPWTVPAGDTPIAMTRDAAGQFLFVIDKGSDPSAANCGAPPNVACASISVFTMQSGSLSEVAGSPFPVGRIPSALSAITYTAPGTTTAMEVLYVTFNSDPALHNDSTLSAYSVDSSGNLTDLTPGTPYVTATDPISVLAVNTVPAGEPANGGVFVYVGSQANQSGSLSVFQVCPVGNAGCQTNQLVPVGTPATLGQNPVAMVVDPTNNFLYVVCYISNQVYGYRINTTTGALISLNPPYGPTGSQPVALALHPSVNNTGQFLYTSNSAQSTITGFAVSTTSGSMGSPITVDAPAAPSGMAAR